MDSLAELNDHIAAADLIDDARHLPGHQFDIGTEFASERTILSPLPLDAFETGLILQPRRVVGQPAQQDSLATSVV
ncbi:hypothetical protein D2E42_24125 [Mycobacteroides abscessus]|nr:hypothetical protein WU83_18655 [Mycobacterium nebraskense]RIR66552.1 hypothetical protein D2E42_24125 [Mycobacteroides abscessus]SIN58310.1 transposase [Mycobacteroides abscessus subsp. abscessus]